MRTSVKEAAVAVESAKSKAIAATQAVEAARYEVYWAQQSGNATAIAAAQKRMEAAVDAQLLARKAALAASSDFYAKKKKLEATATAQAAPHLLPTLEQRLHKQQPPTFFQQPRASYPQCSKRCGLPYALILSVGYLLSLGQYGA